MTSVARETAAYKYYVHTAAREKINRENQTQHVGQEFDREGKRLRIQAEA